MSVDSAVIRKIANLLARAADEASSPAEIAHALSVAHKLMQQHDLTLDEVSVRHAELGQKELAFDREAGVFVNGMAVAIARLAQCRLGGSRYRNAEVYVFSGLRADVDYADWLLRACVAALGRGARSRLASGLDQTGHSQADIVGAYGLGFSREVIDRIKALLADEPPRTELVLWKQERIAEGFGEPTNAIVRTDQLVKGSLRPAFASGTRDGRDVPLRPELNEGAKLAPPDTADDGSP